MYRLHDCAQQRLRATIAAACANQDCAPHQHAHRECEKQRHERCATGAQPILSATKSGYDDSIVDDYKIEKAHLSAFLPQAAHTAVPSAW